MADKFVAGDVVYLVSEPGIKMTVSTARDADGLQQHVETKWFDGATLRGGSFDGRELRKVGAK